MAKMVKIRALRRFRGRRGALLQPGDEQLVPEGFAMVRVRIGDAELVAPPQEPVKAPLAPSVRKVVEPSETKSEAVEEPAEALTVDDKDRLLARLRVLGVEGYTRRHSVKTLEKALAEAEE